MLLRHQQSFVDSKHQFTVLCAQRASGRSTAAFAAAKKHGARVFSCKWPDEGASLLSSLDQLRSESIVVIDDFEFGDLSDQSIKDFAHELSQKEKVFVTITPKLGGNGFAHKVLRAIPDKKIGFAGTHENPHLPNCFASRIYGVV